MAPNNWSDCWAHTWRATGNHKGKLRDVDNYDAIITDLTCLSSLTARF